MDMLNNAIKGYQNKVLTAAEVIEELIVSQRNQTIWQFSQWT